jgi:hypothetical protein
VFDQVLFGLLYSSGVAAAIGLGWVTEMAETNESVLERFAVQAIAGGANTLKIEYDEGYEVAPG